MAEQELKKISQEELDEILEQHELWVASGKLKGVRADLSLHNLGGLVFPFIADLSEAYFKEADLRRAS